MAGSVLPWRQLRGSGVRLVGSGGRASQLKRRVVRRRQRAPWGPLPRPAFSHDLVLQPVLGRHGMRLSDDQLKGRARFYRTAAVVLFGAGFLLMIASTFTENVTHPTGAAAVLRSVGYALMGLAAMAYALAGWFRGLGGG